MKVKHNVKVTVLRDGRVTKEAETHNMVTTVGLNSMLDMSFRNIPSPTTWYMGLVNNVGFTQFQMNDSMSSHSGWTEFSGYTGDRKGWTVSAAAAGSITNPTPASFVASGNGSIKGFLLTSDATGIAGALFSTAAFSEVIPVESGDDVRVTYTISLSE